MKITLRSVRSGWRLGNGGLLLPSALNRGRNGSEWDLISVDVFGTLLARTGDDDAAWREGTLHAAKVARGLGLVPDADPVALRRMVERRLSTARVAAGQDPEFSHTQVLEEVLRHWGAGQWANEAAVELAAWEWERELSFTRPVERMALLVREWADAGTNVIAVSDTRYSARELAVLLSNHGIVGLSAVYASADEGASKFSGRLFDVVAKRESVELRRVLHIGDDLYTDVLSASQRGLAVKRVQRPSTPGCLPEAPPRQDDCGDPAFAVGYQTVGPILVAFTRLLIDQARHDGIQRLAFVARDGELLLRVAQTLIRDNKSAAGLTLKYLHLSRRSLASASPELQHLSSHHRSAELIVGALREIRRTGSMLESFCSYYHLPAELLSQHVKRLRAENGNESDVRRLLGDELAATDLAEEFRLMRERVRRYLIQEQVLCENTALVDIGWRGSLQKILSAESKAWELPAPRGYYLGLWNDSSRSFPDGAIGLITDQRRGRGLHEGSAWHAAFLLEAICRAKHGTVAAFADGADGIVQPVHVELGGTREAERESERTQARIQNGVLAYAEWFAAACPLTVADVAAVRRETQRRLHRLAFFPTDRERGMGRLLVHSEPTSDGAALWLIAGSGVGLSGWIAGLRSPWKAGYIRASGGAIAAGVYCGAEALVSQLPPGTKSAIRRLLIRE